MAGQNSSVGRTVGDSDRQVEDKIKIIEQRKKKKMKKRKKKHT
jgi:hypothetical protein